MAAYHNPANPPPRSAAHRKAMDQFAVPRQASAAIQHELEQGRQAADANTAKLRALRLAKEEADREAAALAAANAPPPKPRKPRRKMIIG
ncbi:MAG TPA: hypothetical protein VGC36_17725 [Rhizomicrobium sp.]